jgi:hypothetical protein
MRTRAICTLALGVAMAACSEVATPASPTEAECPPPGFAEAPALVPFESLNAIVEDLEGNPLDGVQAQACGVNLCLNASTDADGRVFIDAAQMLDKPAFKYGHGRRYAKFAFPLESGPTHDLGTHQTIELPPPESGVEFVAGASITSGNVTLELPENLGDLHIDPFDYDTEELARFRAIEVPVDQAPPAVDGGLELERLFATAPSGAQFCPPAALTVDNTLDWEPGSEVEFYLHGVEVDELWAPYGGWAKVSSGTVSENGATISTDPDEGIPTLGVLGVRLVD